MLTYEGMSLPEIDSNIGRIARHDRIKAFQDDSANDGDSHVSQTSQKCN